MSEPTNRFVVKVEEGGSRGGLYELEQMTYHHVIDTRSGKIVMTFEGEMSASLSKSNGQWDDYSYSGVRDVTIAPDERSARLKYYGGREETVPLPE